MCMTKGLLKEFYNVEDQKETTLDSCGAFYFELCLRCYETTQGGHGISLSGFIFAWGGTHATDIAHEIRAIKPVNRKWAHRAPDGDIQAQAPHAALLPSRRLKSTRPIAVGPPATAAALAPADCLSDGLCCGHLGRLSGASQRLGRASFTHAATTGMRGPGVEPWCELHVRGGCGHSRSTRWIS